MARFSGWTFTRWDLWAVPGLALMGAGLLIKILVHDNLGTLVLGVGLACNTVYVFLRAGREQRLKDSR